jgi:hypothetical protein
MWVKRPNQVGHKLLIQGSAKLSELDDILKASEFAASCGMIKKDNQYSYTTFCIAFTTKELLKTLNALDSEGPDAST